MIIRKCVSWETSDGVVHRTREIAERYEEFQTGLHQLRSDLQHLESMPTEIVERLIDLVSSGSVSIIESMHQLAEQFVALDSMGVDDSQETGIAEAVADSDLHRWLQARDHWLQVGYVQRSAELLATARWGVQGSDDQVGAMQWVHSCTNLLSEDLV